MLCAAVARGQGLTAPIVPHNNTRTVRQRTEEGKNLAARLWRNRLISTHILPSPPRRDKLQNLTATLVDTPTHRNNKTSITHTATRSMNNHALL
jgi:hypothetical protein